MSRGFVVYIDRNGRTSRQRAYQPADRVTGDGFLVCSEHNQVFTIWFSAAHLTLLQVRALQPILLQQRHKPVHLVFNFDGLMEERCDMETAISRLKRLCVAQTAPRSRRIFTRRLPLDTLASSEDFNIPLLAWHERGGALPTDPVKLYDDARLNTRMAWVKSSVKGFYFEYLGPSFTIYNNTGSRTAGYQPRQMISEQNDKVYAHWTQAGYARLLNENQPVLEEVDAQIKQTSGSFNRRRYVRLLLPWRTPEGARHITLASYLKVDLTLPLISSEAELVADEPIIDERAFLH